MNKVLLNLYIGTLLLIVTEGVFAEINKSNYTIRMGSRVYVDHCSSCHGNGGMGDGVVALEKGFAKKTNLLTSNNLLTSDHIFNLLTNRLEEKFMFSDVKPRSKNNKHI